MLFRDRTDAGRRLASWLETYRGRDDVIVLGLARGGIPVAFEVARALAVELDVFLVRKLGVPRHEELAVGAIASGGARVMNEDVVRIAGLDERAVERVATRESEELQRRERLDRGGMTPPVLRGKTVLLVDDGLATGARMAVAVTAIRRESPAEIIVAVPTGSAGAVERLRSTADFVVCLDMPEPYFAVSQSYAIFAQTTDEEIVQLLDQARRSHASERSHTVAPPP